MALSRSALAARANGYGSLKAFREVQRSTTFRLAASLYAYRRGWKGANARRALAATSEFARLWGKAYYKDGKLRARPDARYLRALERRMPAVPLSADEWDKYG